MDGLICSIWWAFENCLNVLEELWNEVSFLVRTEFVENEGESFIFFFEVFWDLDIGDFCEGREEEAEE
jgi:hypothetical protein